MIFLEINAARYARKDETFWVVFKHCAKGNSSMEVKREKESFTMKMVRRPMKVNSKGIICTGKDLSSIPKMDLSFSKVPYSMAAYSMAHFFIDFYK